jgi:hypothetical protein
VPLLRSFDFESEALQSLEQEILRVELFDHDLLTFEFDVLVDDSFSATFESRPFCDFVDAITHLVKVYVHLSKDVIVTTNFHSQGCAHGLDGESSLVMRIYVL